MTGKKHEHIVKSIMPGSIAEELGIEPGDKLLSIDGQILYEAFQVRSNSVPVAEAAGVK